MMLLMAIFAPWVANAETIVDIGNGTSQDYYVPISTSNNDSLSSCNSVSFNTLTNFTPTSTYTLTVFDGEDISSEVPASVSDFDFFFTRSQFVIPANDLIYMRGSTIRSMKFYTDSYDFNYTTACTVDVYLKKVNYTTLSAYEPKESCTIVYQGSLEFVDSPDGAELTINFNQGYAYNGGNLLIGIENTTIGDGSYIDFYGQTVEGASGAGIDLFSLENVPFTQQDFIPKTTFTCFFGELCPRPTNLAASEVTLYGATLTWSTDASASVLEYGMVADSTSATSMSVSGTTANLTGLTPGTTYYARVKAVCGGSDGESQWSIITIFTTPTTCAIPMNLAATLIPSEGTIATLTWSTDASASVL